MSKRQENEVTSLYICPWSLLDPLCQSQALAYLRELTRDGHRFALLTFEQRKYRLDASAQAAMRERLLEEGIRWYSVGYKIGLSVFQKSTNFLLAFLVGLYVVWRHRPKIIHSRGSLTAAVALPLSRLARAKFLYDADSVLSEEYVDVAHWSRSSLAFRITAGIEKLARRRAASVIFLTEVLREDLAATIEIDTPVMVIPCCVDTSRFCFNAEKREARRDELGLNEEKLFVYVGKIGGWYEVKETFQFYKVAKDQIGAARLLIVSEEPPEAFAAIAGEVGLDKTDFYLKSSTHETVPEWLSASDVGLAFIRSLTSKRGSSPIKVGEYLAVGLPVVMTRGIGDYSRWIEEERLGVIVDSHKTGSHLEAVNQLRKVWSEGSLLSERCRRAAEKKVSLEAVGGKLYKEVYRNLLSEFSSSRELATAGSSPAFTKRGAQ